MPSNAFAQHLHMLLQNADELLIAQRQLLAGRRGRQWGIGAFNRAVVVLCVSAWEGYVEQVVLEAITALRPPAGTSPGMWAALDASARSAIGRFHNPDVANVRRLISESLGLTDITAFWLWRKCTATQARQQLTRVLNYRHEIAHGLRSGLTIPTKYATGLPPFFRRLGSRTDAGIRDYFVNTLGIAEPWSA